MIHNMIHLIPLSQVNQHGGCWWSGAYLKSCHLLSLCRRRPVITYEKSNVISKHNTRNNTSQRGPMVYRINNFTDQSTVYHYSDVILSVMASQITSVPIVYSTVCSGEDQRKHQSSTSLAFVMWFTSEFPSQKASNTENVSISWRLHAIYP